MRFEAILNVLKTGASELSDKVLSCCYKCFKPFFIKWASIRYSQLDKTYITDVSDTAFTDCLIRFREHAVSDRLFESKAPVKSVVFAFFKNCLREQLQKNKRQDEKQDNYLQRIDGPGNGVTQEEGNEIFLKKMEAALARMPLQDRQIITWRHLEHKTIEEIASLLSIEKASAINRIYRCMQRLRQLTLSS